MAHPSRHSQKPMIDFLCRMAKGNMELVTIQQNKIKRIPIKEGEVFLLPSRIPHSPLRPEKGSLGLVVERERCILRSVQTTKCNTNKPAPCECCSQVVLPGRYKECDPPELDGLRW